MLFWSTFIFYWVGPITANRTKVWRAWRVRSGASYMYFGSVRYCANICVTASTFRCFVWKRPPQAYCTTDTRARTKASASELSLPKLSVLERFLLHGIASRHGITSWRTSGLLCRQTDVDDLSSAAVVSCGLSTQHEHARR